MNNNYDLPPRSSIGSENRGKVAVDMSQLVTSLDQSLQQIDPVWTALTYFIYPWARWNKETRVYEHSMGTRRASKIQNAVIDVVYALSCGYDVTFASWESHLLN